MWNSAFVILEVCGRTAPCYVILCMIDDMGFGPLRCGELSHFPMGGWKLLDELGCGETPFWVPRLASAVLLLQ